MYKLHKTTDETPLERVETLLKCLVIQNLFSLFNYIKLIVNEFILILK